jgi:hypothetical protein
VCVASCAWRVASCVWRVASCVRRVASCVRRVASCVLQPSAAHTVVRAVVRAVPPVPPCPVPPGTGPPGRFGFRPQCRPSDGARCLRRIALRQRNDDEQQLRRVDRVRARHVLDQLHSGARHRPIGGGPQQHVCGMCEHGAMLSGAARAIGRRIGAAAMTIHRNYLRSVAREQRRVIQRFKGTGLRSSGAL